MKKLFLKNKYFYGTVALLILLESIVLLIATKAEVSLWINGSWTPFLDYFVKLINNIGTTGFTFGVVAMLWALKGWRTALKGAICFFCVMLVTQFMKHVIFPGTPRPTLYFSLYFPQDPLRFLAGVQQLATESFPSGHTSASFALATFFALYLPKKRLHWLLAILAFGVSYARIYMLQHFITDVYMGMWIGVLVTTLVYYFYPKKWEKRDTKS
jgi:membrane-associated phospholipid phosphatase